MDLREEQILDIDTEEHWYYKAKALYVSRYIQTLTGSDLLDVGAGSGFFSKWLLENTSFERATCIDNGYRENQRVFLAEKTINYRMQYSDEQADLVLMMDVLEHVDDESVFLSEYIQEMPKGTMYLMTVPAFPFLWSSHDVFLNHKRRYTIKTLSNVICKSGLSICKINYCFFGVFPLVAFLRGLENVFRKEGNVEKSQLKRHSIFVNKFLYGLCLLELPFVEFNKLAGLSVVCLSEKR